MTCRRYFTGRNMQIKNITRASHIKFGINDGENTFSVICNCFSSVNIASLKVQILLFKHFYKIGDCVKSILIIFQHKSALLAALM